VENARAAAVIRDIGPRELEAVIAIDAQISGTAKADYWQLMYQRYAGGDRGDRDEDRDAEDRGSHFLICLEADEVLGFILGEVRAWEFGSPPCGWVFGIGVRAERRLHGVGSALLERLCERFRAAGVDRVRTMVSRRNRRLLAFFRSQAMMAGPYVELEKAIP